MEVMEAGARQWELARREEERWGRTGQGLADDHTDREGQGLSKLGGWEVTKSRRRGGKSPI